jgi:hypothetical protein
VKRAAAAGVNCVCSRMVRCMDNSVAKQGCNSRGERHRSFPRACSLREPRLSAGPAVRNPPARRGRTRALLRGDIAGVLGEATPVPGGRRAGSQPPGPVAARSGARPVRSRRDRARPAVVAIGAAAAPPCSGPCMAANLAYDESNVSRRDGATWRTHRIAPERPPPGHLGDGGDVPHGPPTKQEERWQNGW